MGKPAARVLLVDDHALVRAGLRSLLQTIPGIEVVGEAGDGIEALAQIEAQRPHLVLMDIAMGGMNGLQALAVVRERHPEVKVLILSMHASEEYVLQAMRSGAAGYLLKDAATAELELALASVLRGETYLSPRVSRQVVEGYVHRVAAERPGEDLTPRQREVLRMLAEGNSTKEIAFKLNLSVKTIETHRAQIMERLDIHELAGLVRYAVRVGLVPPDR
jgi:DNA-binding NarL/FixJ family response regulator